LGNLNKISVCILVTVLNKKLSKKATVKESLTVQKEGKMIISGNVALYKLDDIISIWGQTSGISG